MSDVTLQLSDRTDGAKEVAHASTSIVVVGYKGRSWLPGCLSSLASATEDRARLILVDNAENGPVEELPTEAFEARILPTPRPLGFAEANNFALGAGALESDAVCFLNQDTVSGAGWLDACLRLLHEEPSVGAVSPLLTTYDGQGWDRDFSTCAEASEAFVRDRERGRLGGWYEVPRVTAAAMVVRTEALVTAGPFDPIFGSYYEDFDLCRRIREAGYRIGICGDGRVGHYNGSATTDSHAQRRRMRQVIRNRVIYRLRASKRGRLWNLARQFGWSLPYDLGRGLMRTPSSQPPTVQLMAHLDLLRLAWRVGSVRNDRVAWRRYLRVINWNEGKT